ncbi:MAG: hypothetical protein ACSHYF_08325 [Verrucomicrobiaceae bacterium]
MSRTSKLLKIAATVSLIAVLILGFSFQHQVDLYSGKIRSNPSVWGITLKIGRERESEISKIYQIDPVRTEWINCPDCARMPQFEIKALRIHVLGMANADSISEQELGTLILRKLATTRSATALRRHLSRVDEALCALGDHADFYDLTLENFNTVWDAPEKIIEASKKEDTAYFLQWEKKRYNGNWIPNPAFEGP